MREALGTDEGDRHPLRGRPSSSLGIRSVISPAVTRQDPTCREKVDKVSRFVLLVSAVVATPDLQECELASYLGAFLHGHLARFSHLCWSTTA